MHHLVTIQIYYFFFVLKMKQKDICILFEIIKQFCIQQHSAIFEWDYIYHFKFSDPPAIGIIMMT